jgi:short-subunit dehydrogenase
MRRVPSIAGSWAIVTGASSGIGLEFTRQLAGRGCNIVAVSNQEAQLAELQSELTDLYGVSTVTLNLDLTAPDAAEAVATACTERGITPLILVNNAGIFDFRAVEHLSPRRLDTYIDLHMRAVTHLCHRFSRMMMAQGRGYILNMSSMACWMPMPGIAMYSATKAYIRAFSRALAQELRGTGVSVTVACPGGIATDLFGLPRNLQHLGVQLRVLDTPQRFARKALKCMFRGKAQYINGWLNRLTIVAVGALPERARHLVKTVLLDRFDRPQPK